MTNKEHIMCNWPSKGNVNMFTTSRNLRFLPNLFFNSWLLKTRGYNSIVKDLFDCLVFKYYFVEFNLENIILVLIIRRLRFMNNSTNRRLTGVSLTFICPKLTSSSSWSHAIVYTLSGVFCPLYICSVWGLNLLVCAGPGSFSLALPFFHWAQFLLRISLATRVIFWNAETNFWPSQSATCGNGSVLWCGNQTLAAVAYGFCLPGNQKLLSYWKI